MSQDTIDLKKWSVERAIEILSGAPKAGESLVGLAGDIHAFISGEKTNCAHDVSGEVAVSDSKPAMSETEEGDRKASGEVSGSGPVEKSGQAPKRTAHTPWIPKKINGPSPTNIMRGKWKNQNGLTRRQQQIYDIMVVMADEGLDLTPSAIAVKDQNPSGPPGIQSFLEGLISRGWIKKCKIGGRVYFEIIKRLNAQPVSPGATSDRGDDDSGRRLAAALAVSKNIETTGKGKVVDGVPDYSGETVIEKVIDNTPLPSRDPSTPRTSSSLGGGEFNA